MAKSVYYGTHGDSVLEKQQQMNALGAGLEEDGNWGPLTEKAYQKYGGQLNATSPAAPAASIDLSQQIRNYYGQQLADKIKAANASSDAAKQPYTYNISQAGKTYQPKLNDAYTANAVQERALAERLANMGLGAAGGTSQTQATNLSNNFLGKLTGIGLEKQNYIDTQKNAMSQLDAQNQANVANITAENQAGMNQALTDQKKWAESYYLNLYLSGKISETQYNNYINALNVA
jgi:hypothetical protein